MIHEVFTSTQVCRIVNMSPKRLRYLSERGLIRPSVNKANGKGFRNLYSYTDLRALTLIKNLRQRGLSLQKLQKCEPLMKLLRNCSHGLSDLAVATDGKTIYVSEDRGNEFADSLKEGQLVFTLTIPQIERDLEAKVFQIENYGPVEKRELGGVEML